MGTPEVSLVVTRVGERELAASGELDLATAPILERFAWDVPVAGLPITLDLSGVTFLDSSGLAAMIRLRRDGYQLRLRNPSDAVLYVIRLTATHALFPIVDSNDELVEPDSSGGDQRPAG